MKKVIIPIIIFALLIAVSSYAIRTRVLTDVWIDRVTIVIEKEGEDWTANFDVMGHVLDDLGNIDKQEHMIMNRKDLPAQVRGTFDAFLQLLATEFSKQMVNENKNPLPILN